MTNSIKVFPSDGQPKYRDWSQNVDVAISGYWSLSQSPSDTFSSWEWSKTPYLLSNVDFVCHSSRDIIIFAFGGHIATSGCGEVRKRMYFETECVMAIQSHLRSLILVPIEIAYALPISDQ